VIPATFDYEVAESADQAIELLGETDNPKLLAGGQSLLPLMKLRLARPATLIDLGGISGLDEVCDGGDHLAIGALTRHHVLEHDPLVREHAPLLALAAAQVGDRQVRHRGTIGGSLAHADPAGDLPTVALTLDAQLVARGPDGERVIPASEFFRGYWATALAAGELLTEVRIPKHGGAGCAYVKFRRRALDWATVGVAAVVQGDVARVGLVNMAQQPLRATAVEEAYDGDAAAAAAHADEGTHPVSDTFASADFRRHLVRVLTERALAEAVSRD
jgi:carbon-monoxide dehydrogenase medium subunit